MAPREAMSNVLEQINEDQESLDFWVGNSPNPLHYDSSLRAMESPDLMFLHSVAKMIPYFPNTPGAWSIHQLSLPLASEHILVARCSLK